MKTIAKYGLGYSFPRPITATLARRESNVRLDFRELHLNLPRPSQGAKIF